MRQTVLIFHGGASRVYTAHCIKARHRDNENYSIRRGLEALCCSVLSIARALLEGLAEGLLIQ